MNKFLIASMSLATATLAAPALAYFGPGAALGLVGYFFGFVFSFGLALLILLYYPMRKLWKHHKARKLADSSMPVEGIPEADKLAAEHKNDDKPQ